MRSAMFVSANENFNRIPDLGLLGDFEHLKIYDFEELHNIFGCFDPWLEAYLKKKYVMLSKGDEFVFVRGVTRFMDEYRDVVRQRFRALKKIRWDLKIELTVDPKMFMDLHSEFEALVKGWNRLRSYLITFMAKIRQKNLALFD